MRNGVLGILCVMACVLGGEAKAQVDVDYQASMVANVSDGALAPYYTASNRYGTLTQGKSLLVSGAISHRCDSVKAFSYGFGAEVWGGYSSSAAYDRYDATSQGWTSTDCHPSRLWLQQLYGELKYRCLYVMAGQKNHRNALTDAALSSGDMVLSGNSRPMPGVAAGFVGFQDVPYTKGWVQIDAEVGFYRDTQDAWLKNHYNYYNDFVTTDAWMNYKRCYFRTKPSERLSVTIGMQAACQFGGYQYRYHKGAIIEQSRSKVTLKTFFHALIPGAGAPGGNAGDAQYKEGNHVGSWDVSARYRLDEHRTLRAYYQSLFEDGSGIGKLNGWDGLYGLEYRNAKPALVTGVVVEYMDLMNQSGPIHWAPNDFPGTPMQNEATGADNYYNNFFYNGYTERGMSIGSPFVKSTIYNRDGYLEYTDNRMRGCHVAVTGYLLPQFTYRAMASYRKSWGTMFVPNLSKRCCTSVMVEGNYKVKRVAGMNVGVEVAMDRGSLYGNNFGVAVTMRYCGKIGK